MSALSAIHAKRRDVHSLKEDDAWYDFVEKHTGQRSTRGLSPKQTKALILALNAMGAKRVTRRKTITGPYAKKIQALWIACWNMGLIKSRDDRSLNRFATKQASVSHANWIRDPEDARAVIEALKKMLERKGVDWFENRLAHPVTHMPGFKIAFAQWRIVMKIEPYSSQDFGVWVEELTGNQISDCTAENWMDVMNTLGRVVRGHVNDGAVS